MANKKEEKFQKATSWFVAMWPQKLHWTWFFFFFVLCPRAKPASRLQRFCSTMKKKFLFLQRMASLLTIGHLLLLLCKTLQRPDYDRHVEWNLCHERVRMCAVFRPFHADSAAREAQSQIRENGACILIYNWIKVYFWPNMITLYNNTQCLSPLGAETGLPLYNMTETF